jgi:hypothetical protein
MQTRVTPQKGSDDIYAPDRFRRSRSSSRQYSKATLGLYFQFAHELLRAQRLAQLSGSPHSVQLFIAYLGPQADLPVLVAPLAKPRLFHPIEPRPVEKQVLSLRRSMRPRARPPPVTGLGCNAGANGIQIHIAHRGKKVCSVQWTREETILPEVPDPAPVSVLFHGILRMRLTQGARQRFSGSGNRYQVDMIGHQAPSQDSQVITTRVVTKHLDVVDSVFFRKENGLPIVAALRNVMRHSRYHDSRSASHAE